MTDVKDGPEPSSFARTQETPRDRTVNAGDLGARGDAFVLDPYRGLRARGASRSIESPGSSLSQRSCSGPRSWRGTRGTDSWCSLGRVC
jgi:hypothetical protein